MDASKLAERLKQRPKIGGRSLEAHIAHEKVLHPISPERPAIALQNDAQIPVEFVPDAYAE
jgi:hypothetical protein